MSEPRGSRWTTLAMAGLLLGGLAHLGVLLVGGWSAINAPTAIEYGEPFIVSASYYLGQGGTLYAPVEDLPFLHNNYNPLLQTVLAPWMGAKGPSYVPLRAITFGSVLALLAVVGWSVHRCSGRRLDAGAAALLPLTCGFMFPWMAVGRVDAFATLCSALGFVWMVFHRNSALFWRLVGLGFFWVAFATKQSVIGGCGAALLFGFLDGRRRESVGLGVVFVGGCAAIMGVAQAWTDGQYWLHTMTYNASHERGPWWPEGVPPLALLEAYGWPLVIGLVAMSFAVTRKDLPWVCWTLVTLVLGLALVRKSGSHLHYFLEGVVSASVLVGVVGARASARVQGRGLPVAALIGLMALASIPGRPWESRAQWRSGLGFKYAQARHFARLRAEPQQVPSEVARRIRESRVPPLLLAQTATLAVECGRPAIFDVADFTRLQELGRWSSEDRLLPLVRQHVFPVIAVQTFGDAEGEQRFGVSGIVGLPEAIEKHYRPLEASYSDPHGRPVRFFVPSL